MQWDKEEGITHIITFDDKSQSSRVPSSQVEHDIKYCVMIVVTPCKEFVEFVSMSHHTPLKRRDYSDRQFTVMHVKSTNLTQEVRLIFDWRWVVNIPNRREIDVITTYSSRRRINAMERRYLRKRKRKDWLRSSLRTIIRFSFRLYQLYVNLYFENCTYIEIIM